MKKKISNANRNFGILFFIVFFIIAFWSFRGNFYQIKILPFCISLIFLVLGLLNSKILSPLNKIWIKFGEILGMIISPIVMFFIYFAFVSPLALILRLFGKDLLKTKFSKSKSYWISRKKNIGSMKKQF
jgi:hypothetical protein